MVDSGIFQQKLLVIRPKLLLRFLLESTCDVEMNKKWGTRNCWNRPFWNQPIYQGEDFCNLSTIKSYDSDFMRDCIITGFWMTLCIYFLTSFNYPITALWQRRIGANPVSCRWPNHIANKDQCSCTSDQGFIDRTFSNWTEKVNRDSFEGSMNPRFDHFH